MLDANLLLLLVVGRADLRLVGGHKRLSGFAARDVVSVRQLLDEFVDLLLVPNVVTEVSNVADWGMKGPAKRSIQQALRDLVESTRELYVPSFLGVARSEYAHLGLTDAILLELCHAPDDNGQRTLVTVDEELHDHPLALGLSVIDYRQYRLALSRNS